MKKIVAFCPADHSEQNDKFFNQLEKSLRKFHTEEELPLIRYDLSDNQDPQKWYKATPLIASQLIKEYETVIKLDADQIITGSLDELINDTRQYEVGVVLNDPSFVYMVWDIKPYLNNGLVVMKSELFIQHWLKLCNSDHFSRYQMREQDLLNILCSDYSNYVAQVLDGKNIYGEVAKPNWSQAILKDDKVMIGDSELKVIHFGGGNSPDKGNYEIRFSEEIVDRIKELIS